MKNILPKWPEVVFGSSESTRSQAIRRALLSGQLRKIAPRIYTSNLTDPLSTIVSRNCYEILGELYPEGVISHRSALLGGVSKGVIFVTYKYTKKITLPGLTIYLLKGLGPQPGDMSFMGKLYISSPGRAYLENLQQSRGRDHLRKSLSVGELEERLDKLCRVYGEEELNVIREQARQLAQRFSMKKELDLLEQIIGAVLGSKPIEILNSDAARARAIGEPYDGRRLEILDNLFKELRKNILPIKKEMIESREQLENLAFFESYFSNYIEGTEFEVEEAREIIFYHKQVPKRPKDAHDIIATFQIVANLSEMSKVPTANAELITLLKKRHKILMEGREEKNPGEFKTIANRVGNNVFVAPELMQGTFAKAFSYYENLDQGIQRAIFIMFLVSEVHPFLDGNGRIARIMMNAELAFSRQCRIIIPTVYREDYLLTLRRLSIEGDPDAYIRMLLRAQKLTADIDFSDFENALGDFKNANAFMEPYEAKLILKDEYEK